MSERIIRFRWLSNVLLVGGIGFLGWAAFGALKPGRIDLFVADPSALDNRIVGETRRIPVAAVNRTVKRIRLVGTNAC